MTKKEKLEEAKRLKSIIDAKDPKEEYSGRTQEEIEKYHQTRARRKRGSARKDWYDQMGYGNIYPKDFIKNIEKL